MLEQQLEIGHAFDTQQEEQQHQQMLKYQAELEQQLAEQEKKKQELYEEFLKEKLMIDEICMRIYDEDQKEIEAKLEKQRATRKYIEDFKRKREEVSFFVTCIYIYIYIYIYKYEKWKS